MHSCEDFLMFTCALQGSHNLTVVLLLFFSSVFNSEEDDEDELCTGCWTSYVLPLDLALQQSLTLCCPCRVPMEELEVFTCNFLDIPEDDPYDEHESVDSAPSILGFHPALLPPCWEHWRLMTRDMEPHACSFLHLHQQLSPLHQASH